METKIKYNEEFCSPVSLDTFFFVVVLGLLCCARVFTSCRKQGPLWLCEGFLLQLRSVLYGMRASVVATRRLRGSVARSMWDLPRPRVESASPALQGRFLTTGPPGKPSLDTFKALNSHMY